MSPCGVGYEIGYALAQNKRVMAFAQKEAKVARIILGINDKNFSFQTYESAEEIINAVKQSL
jgi:nucleoside 2-deoxyribosyltransferase